MDPATRALLDAIRVALEAKVEPARVLGALDYVLDGGSLRDAAHDLRELAEREEV